MWGIHFSQENDYRLTGRAASRAPLRNNIDGDELEPEFSGSCVKPGGFVVLLALFLLLNDHLMADRVRALHVVATDDTIMPMQSKGKYAVERQGKEASVEERLKLRQQQSAPLLAELHDRLLQWKEQLLPRHPMAEAINCVLGQWQELNVFSTDGAVHIDNNVSEREMKRVLNRNYVQFLIMISPVADGARAGIFID